MIHISEIEAFKPSVAKDFLYPGSTDKIIQEINDCSTEADLAKFTNNAKDLETAHVCQLIIAIWDHVKANGKARSLDMEAVVLRAGQKADEMTVDELSCCFFYLHKLGVSIKHPAMQKIIQRTVEHIKHDKDVPLYCLTRFTLVIGSDKNLYASIIATSTIPAITSRMTCCHDPDDFYLITVCLNNISHVLTLDLHNVFKRKVEQFLDQGLLNETTPKTIFRIINFLNYPHWSFRNGGLIRRLLLELDHNIKFLDAHNLFTVNRAFHSQLESAKLVPLMVKRAQILVEKTPNVELLALAVLHVTPTQRMEIAEMIRQFLSTYQITSTHTGETLQAVFKILRLLKISDIGLCDTYWRKALNEIYGTKESNVHYRLSKHIQKYMYFNNNLGGTYRHLEFEKSMIEMLLVELKTLLQPKDFAKYASFIIAYGDGTGTQTVPRFIVDKIEQLHEQFSIQDSLQLSRGLQILQEMRVRRPFTKELELKLESINFSLEKSAKRHLKAKDLHLSEMNAIVRAYNNRRAPRDTYIFYKMIKYYESEQLSMELSSRTIRDIIYNLGFCNFRMDSVCDRFVDYILDNWDHVTGETVEKILTYCYSFSYFPEKVEVLDRSSEIVVRDFNYMNGISIVQALLALVFYKSCPQQLITMVFSDDFIKRLEQEISMCYSKNTYPQRVMNQVMQLNRAVCLDCPEMNVKWFQQSYIEAQGSKLPAMQSRLQVEVTNLLLDIVKSEEFLGVNRVTPYGYRVDFELFIDQYNRFVKPLPEDYHHVNYLPHVNKIAILLLNNKVFCDNDFNRLKGSELLRMRHLEMLGYRVIHVKISDFNALYKNVKAKLKYLRNLLQLTD